MPDPSLERSTRAQISEATLPAADAQVPADLAEVGEGYSDPTPPNPPANTATYAELLAERERLQDQIGRFNTARAEDADVIEQLRADLAREVSARINANAERDAMAKQITDLGAQWVEINQPFHALCERVIDSGRLVGFEVEINGERHLIGDVNPGGHKEGGQAFRRDALVTRARVRVRK
jgi:hypothetical protein